ncbi:hypothetical protein HFP51_13600 [Parasphingopyxis sp. CP4]|nr:hypothetical protein [Parasphingopyxis sp. CP4]QLC23127.1 hypothetical protein HFP51_13600 [Parasphingopyxis sp. CP4]
MKRAIRIIGIGAALLAALLEDAGHALLPEQPDAIAEAVLGFLDSIE